MFSLNTKLVRKINNDKKINRNNFLFEMKFFFLKGISKYFHERNEIIKINGINNILNFSEP
jgi:hypothetical protein